MVNLMNIKKLLTITLICIGFATAAMGEIVSQAYELNLEQFVAPTTSNSGISFRECDDCEYLRMRVTERTSYSVNGKNVRLEDFRRAVSQIRDRENAFVTVLRHLESNTVVSISVTN